MTYGISISGEGSLEQIEQRLLDLVESMREARVCGEPMENGETIDYEDSILYTSITAYEDNP